MKQLTPAAEAERSINTTYRNKIWAPFIKAVKQFRMISQGDKIAVCISGGKDSVLLAKLMQMLHRITEIPFEVVYLCMNPGYSHANEVRIRENAALLDIPLTMFDSDIFDVAYSAGGSPCYLCARMRRGCLYAKAKELGCNKIALGHHMDDVVETTLMAMLYGGQLQGMLPRLESKNFDGMQLIRPMYYVSESDVIRWRDHNQLRFIACACKFTENNYGKIDESKSARYRTKALIAELRKEIPDVDNHILKSIFNCQLDTMVGYKTNDEMHSFLERFE